LHPYVGVDLKEVTHAPRPTAVSKAATLAYAPSPLFSTLLYTSNYSYSTLQALAATAPASTSSTSAATSSTTPVSAASSKRLLKEFQSIQSSNMEVYLTDNNIAEWKLFLNVSLYIFILFYNYFWFVLTRNKGAKGYLIRRRNLGSQFLLPPRVSF
jgi:hypothetical protein